MVLEAVMVCLDNSLWTRNGDYSPTRFEAQVDSMNLVCGAKTQQNPENSVGILSSAGDRVEVVLTPTSDLGKMLADLNRIKVSGTSDLARGIQTAQLALKHRQNKNQKQRIIAFVGSPVEATEKQLETLGKNLKKNNVSLDLVSFGEVEENKAKLEKLLQAVNSNETSHLVEIPVGPKLLSDVLLSSPIITPEGEAPMAGGGGGGDGAGFEFGINPAEDPELALALRISMEEERARQQKADGGEAKPEGEAGAATTGEAAATPAAAGGDAAPAAGTAAAAAGGAAAATTAPAPEAASNQALLEAMGGMEMDDMDEELRQALLMSLQDANPPAATPAPATEPAPAAAPAEEKKDVPMTEAPAAPAAEAPAKTEEKDVDMKDAAGYVASGVDTKWFQDPSFVTELLGTLPGVDINDPRIQEALKSVGAGDEEKDKKDEKGDGGSGSGSK
jgi:26S proteasome regulatory subunit N10